MSANMLTRIPTKFLGAFKQGHRSYCREFIDDELSIILLARLRRHPDDTEATAALEFLTKFNNEYHKGFLRKGDETALHNTAELYKSCSDRNNARNADIMLETKQNPYKRVDIYVEIIKKY